MESTIEPQISTEKVDVFTRMENMNHEQVVFCQDEHTGLKSIIGIHNTVLGPAVGGARMWNYKSEGEALNDVLRLSRGMTFKSALAGLNIGGGKAVIIGDAKTQKDEALIRRFGKFINGLGGRYYTAEDVNINLKDVTYMSMETPYVLGKPETMGGSGDPSPMTAYGVYMGMKASAKKVYGSDSLENKKIVVQGAGKVGFYLISHLCEENAKIFVTDIYEDKIEELVKEYPAVTVIDSDSVYDQEMDIYSPCALGATLNDESIFKLKCAVIAGAANNQLKDEKIHGKLLKEQGILYAPDFLINSGGIANVYHELLQDYSRENVLASTEHIYNVCLDVFCHSHEENICSHEAALELALARIEKIGKLKLSY